MNRYAMFFCWKEGTHNDEIKRRNGIISIALSFSVAVCRAGFFGGNLLGAYIRAGQTSMLGTTFLRIACMAVPFTSVNAFS